MSNTRSKIDLLLKSRLPIKNVYDYDGLLDELEAIIASGDVAPVDPPQAKKKMETKSPYFVSNIKTALRFSAATGEKMWSMGYRYAEVEWDEAANTLYIFPWATPGGVRYKINRTLNSDHKSYSLSLYPGKLLPVIPYGRYYKEGQKAFVFKWEGADS